MYFLKKNFNEKYIDEMSTEYKVFEPISICFKTNNYMFLFLAEGGWITVLKQALQAYISST